MVTVALVLLALFVAWGATVSPRRPFSWGMYSGSTKGFLWAEAPDGPRVLGYDELRLAPDSHFLSLPDLYLLAAEQRPEIPLQGLIIGSQGSWSVTYDSEHLVVTPLPAGTELGHLVTALRRLS